MNERTIRILDRLRLQREAERELSDLSRRQTEHHGGDDLVRRALREQRVS